MCQPVGHAWLNCMMTRVCGRSIAQDFYSAHEEDGNVAQTCANASMDLNSNEIGRAIGDSCTHCTCEELVMRELLESPSSLLWYHQTPVYNRQDEICNVSYNSINNNDPCIPDDPPLIACSVLLCPKLNASTPVAVWTPRVPTATPGSSSTPRVFPSPTR